MRIICDALKAKLLSRNWSSLGHKLLLYRRKWENGKYIIEETPTDISDSIDYKGTNVSINQQLDTEMTNVWKVGNLNLTLYNKNNRFWQDKEDGLFPEPYILYGSKIEYFIGDITITDYVKQFTGYLTQPPTYRQDNALIEFQVLNRLDFLKTVSAETVSKNAADETPVADPAGQTAKYRTLNPAVGRFFRIMQIYSDGSSRNLVEETDYTLADLNEYGKGALIELTSVLLPGESLRVDYIYWWRNLTIDALVLKLLDAADIGENERIVENVVFENQARIEIDLLNKPMTARFNYILDNGKLVYRSRGYSNTGVLANINQNEIDIYLKGGRLGFSIPMPPMGVTSVSPVYLYIGTDIYDLSLVHPVPTTMTVLLRIAKNNVVLYQELVTPQEFFVDLSDGVKFYASSSLIYTDGSGEKELTRALIGIGSGSATFSRCFTKYGFEINQSGFEFERLSMSGESWADFIATYTVIGNPIFNFFILQNNQIIPIQINSNLSGFNDIVLFFHNPQSKDNGVSFSLLKLRYFQTSNIELGVCNLTNMSVLQALHELASMAMYEIGFDADDIFFFRPRERAAYIKEFTDKQIISMSSAKSDVNRVKTQVAVTYGNFNKIINSDTQKEPHPNNKDRYGDRLYELSGGQLLPADNVDLTEAVAITTYEELSKLRIGLSVDVALDLELELGDYVRILHNNNLWAKPEFTDYTKWEELGTFYMRCKVVGIRTDFNKKITSLTLLDYTSDNDKPVPETEGFRYPMMSEFDAKK